MDICKQWRPWSDAAFCDVWSGSALFANYPLGRGKWGGGGGGREERTKNGLMLKSHESTYYVWEFSSCLLYCPIIRRRTRLPSHCLLSCNRHCSLQVRVSLASLKGKWADFFLRILQNTDWNFYLNLPQGNFQDLSFGISQLNVCHIEISVG